MSIKGPVNFTHACGHRGILACISAQPEHLAFISGTICASCRTFETMKAFGIKLDPDVDGVIESVLTHLPCAICNGLFQIELLALRADGGRICETCIGDVQRIAEQKRKLEQEGQERLF